MNVPPDVTVRVPLEVIVAPAGPVNVPHVKLVIVIVPAPAVKAPETVIKPEPVTPPPEEQLKLAQFIVLVPAVIVPPIFDMVPDPVIDKGPERVRVAKF